MSYKLTQYFQHSKSTVKSKKLCKIHIKKYPKNSAKNSNKNLNKYSLKTTLKSSAMKNSAYNSKKPTKTPLKIILKTAQIINQKFNYNLSKTSPNALLKLHPQPLISL